VFPNIDFKESKMSESGFTLNLYPRTLEDGFKMTLGFRKISALENSSEENIKQILSESIGERFVERLMKKLSSISDIEELSEYLPKKSTSEVEYLYTICRINSGNLDLIWLEDSTGKLTSYEVCPDYITIDTRSKDYGEFHTRITLIFNCHATQELKAAVFSAAFVEAGYEIDTADSWDDYEDDEE
jgi:hypothetical protein